MKDAQLRVDDTLLINNENYLHIDCVEVFTGDDEYNETDCVEILPNNDQLLIKQILTRKNKQSEYRLRGEPGVRLFLSGEGGSSFVLTIAHHKGNIHVSAKEIQNEII